MYHLFGLGNAIVDTELRIEDSFLHDQQIAKGHMTLIDSDRMAELHDALEGVPYSRCSGGSAANTTFTVQAFGLDTAYTCKVATDAVGNFFIKEMREAGIHLNTSAQGTSGRSGQCLVMISDDAERTMNTDLGVSSTLASSDVDVDVLRQSQAFYVEGYASASPPTQAAAVLCREQAQEHGVKVAISLSDPSIVEAFRDPLQEMLGNGIDQLFCNEEEALAWARTDRLDIAIAELKDIAPEVYITLGSQGSIAVSEAGRQHAAGYESQAIDTSGAGDIYAGSCMAARFKSASAHDAARFANFCAADLVSRYGARLKSLDDYRALEKRFH